MVYRSLDPNSTQVDIFGWQSTSRENLRVPFKIPKILPQDPPRGVGLLESIFRGFNGCNILIWSPDNGFEKNKQGLTPKLLQLTPFLFLVFTLG